MALPSRAMVALLVLAGCKAGGETLLADARAGVADAEVPGAPDGAGPGADGSSDAAGFRVVDGRLVDGRGERFVIRGINHPHVWFPQRTEQAVEDIAATGANAVRVVLGSGEQWGPSSAADVARVIELLKQRAMVAVLEVHDSTGYPEQDSAAPLSTAVDYWVSIASALMGQEAYVLINIANEPFGNGVPREQWASEHIAAIRSLRDAGLDHTLVVDAANWGQDWEEIMLADAPAVFAADPLANVVFSVHMYEVYRQRARIDTYMSRFVDQHRLPLLVGEFGADHRGQDVDELSILELAERYGVGYLGWSWSGNSGGTEALDIVVDFDAAQVTSWGQTLIDSAHGIRATARPATVF